MIGIVGICIVFVMVFGGYVIAGGKIGIILHSLPYEMMMIAGAALGAFVIANDKHGISHTTVGEIWRAFGLKPWSEDEFKVSPDPDLVDKIRDIVVIQPVSVARKRAKPIPHDSNDAGTSDAQ